MIGRLRETYLPENIDIAIQDNAAGPKRASGDAGSVEQHSLTDQIAADKYLASKAAASGAGGTGLGVRRIKLSPPGAD